MDEQKVAHETKRKTTIVVGGLRDWNPSCALMIVWQFSRRHLMANQPPYWLTGPCRQWPKQGKKNEPSQYIVVNYLNTNCCTKTELVDTSANKRMRRPGQGFPAFTCYPQTPSVNERALLLFCPSSRIPYTCLAAADAVSTQNGKTNQWIRRYCRGRVNIRETPLSSPFDKKRKATLFLFFKLVGAEDEKESP